jgi:hypothetical protein
MMEASFTESSNYANLEISIDGQSTSCVWLKRCTNIKRTAVRVSHAYSNAIYICYKLVILFIGGDSEH